MFDSSTMDTSKKYNMSKMRNVILDKRMNVTVVDSVKGGCGKTSISLKYATMFAQKNSKVCYIDLDILGSSIEAFINGRKFVGKDAKEIMSTGTPYGVSPFRLEVESAAKFYLNEMFNGQAFSERFFNKIRVTESATAATCYFDLIACSPDQDEKDRFKPSRLINYVGQIDYEYFAAMIEKMLKVLEKMGYEQIVIDMPPNSDAYTDSLFNILLRADESGREKIKNLENADVADTKDFEVVTKYNVEICVINSLDRAHFEANFAWLLAMIDERRMEWALNTKWNFKIVFNNNSGIDDRTLIKNYLDRRSMQLRDHSIEKIMYFEYDKVLAINAMDDFELGFDILRESDIEWLMK